MEVSQIGDSVRSGEDQETSERTLAQSSREGLFEGIRAAERVATIRIEPARGWVGLKLRELWEYRELLYFLVWRDIKVRYKQTVLGASWAIIQPFSVAWVSDRAPAPGGPRMPVMSPSLSPFSSD